MRYAPSVGVACDAQKRDRSAESGDVGRVEIMCMAHGVEESDAIANLLYSLYPFLILPL